MIKEGEAIAELVIEDPIRLWSQVPEQYCRRRAARTTRAAHHPGPPRRGRSRARSPGSTRRSRRRAARFRSKPLVPNERGLLRPGGFAKASIIIDAESKAAVVPIDSIVRFAGVTKLFIVENGKARSINDIKTGSRRARLGRGDEQAAPRRPLRSSPPAKPSSPKERPS